MRTRTTTTTARTGPGQPRRGGGNGGNGGNGDVTSTGPCITASSSTGSASPEIQLTFKLSDKPSTAGADDHYALAVGSSVVLYLEDDYQEPDSIPASSVYFVAESPTTDTGNGARVYATNTVKVNNDDYFDRDKNDIAIRVLVPDMCTNATQVCEGPNGLRYGQTVTVVFESDSGIKNPSEEKSVGYKTGYTTLGPTDSIPGMGKFTPLAS